MSSVSSSTLFADVGCKVLAYMGCHAGTALPLPGSCPRTYTVHLRTGTSETYIGSQPATPGGGFVYYGHTHYIWFWEQVADLAYIVIFYFVVAIWCCIDSGFQLSSST